MKRCPSWVAVWLAACFALLISWVAAWLFHGPAWAHLALIGLTLLHLAFGWVMVWRERRRKRRCLCPICGFP